VVTIRAATSDDVPAITDLANALIDTTTYEWTEARHTIEGRSRWLEDKRRHGYPVLVAGDDTVAKVVGWATYGPFRDIDRWPGYRFTVEHTIHVGESHWGRGVGRSLMAALAAHAQQAGLRVMIAGIDGSNAGSIEFHARLGFVEVARMPGIGDKWGQRLDLVLMQREL